MRLRSFAYAVALTGLWATLAATIMLGRRLVTLGAGRVEAGAALLDLATGAAAGWFWGGALGAAVWAGAWRLAERHALPGERDAAGRKALLYGGQLAALGGLIRQAILLIMTLLLQPRLPGAATQAVELAVGAAIALAFWSFLRWITVGDGDFGQEAAPAASWRRLYYYAGAAVTLALFLSGLMELLRIILSVALGLRVTTAVVDRARFAQAAAFALVAAPTWWALWWSQQTRATAAGVMATAERRAASRRFYLYAVILLAAVAFFFGLGMSIFGVVAGRDLALVASWAPIALIALICLVGHLLTLREDERQLQGSPAGDGAVRPTTASQRPELARPFREAAHSEISQSRVGRAEVGRRGSAHVEPPTGPRRFAREALPPAAMRRPPIVLVVDGGDGAVGAQVMAGLAAGLPQATLWPLGLNAAAQAALLNALSGAPPALPADAPARATLIIGPADMLIAGGLAGEVSAELAAAIAGSPAAKLLLPPRDPALRWVAAPAWPVERWVENAVIEAANALDEGR